MNQMTVSAADAHHEGDSGASASARASMPRGPHHPNDDISSPSEKQEIRSSSGGCASSSAHQPVVVRQYASSIRDPQLQWLARSRRTQQSEGPGGGGAAEASVSAAEPPTGGKGPSSSSSSSMAFPELCMTVAGYVVQRRKASRKLLFLDIIEGPSRTGACLELLVKVPNLEV